MFSKKTLDWATIVGAFAAVLALFTTPEWTNEYIHRFLYQHVPLWIPLEIAVLLVILYISYKRFLAKPSIPLPQNTALPTKDVIKFSSKVALLTFDHNFVQVDMHDTYKRLRAAEKNEADKWEEFYLVDPNDDSNTRHLKYGDEVTLTGMNHTIMAADLNNNGEKFVYSGRSEYIKNNWGKFMILPLSSKTNLKIGDAVLYGHPVSLKANNGEYLAYREDVDKFLWVAAKQPRAWEQFTFVALP